MSNKSIIIALDLNFVKPAQNIVTPNFFRLIAYNNLQRQKSKYMIGPCKWVHLTIWLFTLLIESSISKKSVGSCQLCPSKSLSPKWEAFSYPTPIMHVHIRKWMCRFQAVWILLPQIIQIACTWGHTQKLPHNDVFQLFNWLVHTRLYISTLVLCFFPFLFMGIKVDTTLKVSLIYSKLIGRLVSIVLGFWLWFKGIFVTI